jgi:hypothetical protein
LSREFGLHLYEYDRFDAGHHEILARSLPDVRAFLEQPLESRWDLPPEALTQRALRSFERRFPLVVSDLQNIRTDRRVLAEGFGLLPSLVAPFLDDPRRALWLIASDDFKQASWRRRGKPGFRGELSDPERIATNIFRRDMILTDKIRAEVTDRGLGIIDVEKDMSSDALYEQVRERFLPFLREPGRTTA